MANILNILDKDTGKYVSVPAIQGASAYEVAVENGFKGTEKEWLASLKGEGADIDMSEFATISYVDEAIDNLDISDADINLDGYATEEWTRDYINDNIEAISSGYYEAVDIVGEDITNDIVEANGELPILPTYFGGTKYIVNGGLVNMMVNPKNDSDSFYINDYINSDINQDLVLTDSDDGNCSDYLIYGAYNKDLLTKTDLMRPAKSTINKYANLNSLDGYYPSVEYAQDGLSSSNMCGWSFYGNSSNKWIDVRIQHGTVSQKVQDRIDELFNETGHVVSGRYADGSPQAGIYRKSPAVYFKVEPYTSYTINYTGDVGGEKDYMKGLHWKILDGSPSGGGCWDNSYEGHIYDGGLPGGHTTERTVTITTGKNARYLCIFVGLVKSSNARFDRIGFTGTVTSDSASSIDQDIVKYNIEHLSVVQGTQPYEYYIDMIKNIQFKLSITAMSMADESRYEFYELTIPYVMASNQYFRFERYKEMYAVSRPLQKAVGMRLDEMNDTYMNYEAGHVGVIGKWIDSKDVYRVVLSVTLPDGAGTTNISLPDTVDTVVDMRITQQGFIPTTTGTLHRVFYDHQYNNNSSQSTKKMYANINTTLPFEGSTDFYSTMVVTFGGYGNGSQSPTVFIIDYTRYEMDEDGNII
jgi:hypothetical protein